MKAPEKSNSLSAYMYQRKYRVELFETMAEHIMSSSRSVPSCLIDA